MPHFPFYRGVLLLEASMLQPDLFKATITGVLVFVYSLRFRVQNSPVWVLFYNSEISYVFTHSPVELHVAQDLPMPGPGLPVPFVPQHDASQSFAA